MRSSSKAGLLFFAAAVLSSRSVAQIKVRTVKPQIVEERVKEYGGDDFHREATLKGLFGSAGCQDHLSEQPVKGLKQPNLICVLPGDSDAIILVGAHYDHVNAGDGIIDNWTGASLLPSLYQVLSDEKRHFTFVFAAFAGEEKGLVGSRFYVKNVPSDQLKKIRAMICMDTLGLGPTQVWVSRSDKKLVGAFAAMAHAMNLPVTRVDVDGIGYSDEESFAAKKIPVIVIHSITTYESLRILHSQRDNYKALKFDDYYASYRLLSGYLTYIDQELDRDKSNLPQMPSSR